MVDLPFEAYRIPTLVGGLAMLALAAWVFALGPGSRVMRAFGLFLTLRAALSLLLVMDDNVFSVPGRVLGYVSIALPFAALHLANQSWVGRGDARHDSPLRSPWVSVGLLVAVVALELAYFLDHDFMLGRAEDGGAVVGPLAYSVDAIYPAYGLLALVFAFAHARTPPGPRSRSLFDLSLAFVLPPAYSCIFFLLVTVGAWERIDSVEATVYLVLNGLGFALVLGAAALLFARAGARRDAKLRGSALRYSFALLLAFATGVAVYVVMRQWPQRFLYLFTGFGMLWHLVLVGLVAFALVRHRFLDLDVKVKWTVSRSVVASALVATFFVVSEATAAFLQYRSPQLGIDPDTGAYVGIGAAGLLLFALNPLRRFGETVAEVAMPEAQPLERRSLRERMALYAEQMRIAWEDGALTAKERRLLDHVRRRLGLSDDQAARLERDALAEILPDRRSVARPTPHSVRGRVKD